MRQAKWRGTAAVLGVLALAAAAQAQQRISSTGTSSGGGFGGSSGASSGGFTGTSSGGFTGTGSGGFTGTGSGGFTGSGGGTGGRAATGSSTYGRSSIIGRFYGNPLAMGFPATTTGTGTGSTPAQQSIRAFPVTLSFGQPIVDQATLSRGQQGAAGGAGLGTGSALGTSGRASGASSIGTRRSPSYMTWPTFARPEPPPTVRAPAAGAVVVAPPVMRREMVQAALPRAAQMGTGASLNVTMPGDGVVVMSGQMRDERERRITAARLSMTEGVREVRDEVRAPSRARR